jgi:comEA protein
MSVLSKWGFTRNERVAICVLALALVAGICVKQIKQRISTNSLSSLTQEDSLAIYQLNQYTQSLKSLNPDSNLKPEKAQLKPYHLININTASAEELETLPGIGPVLAQKIIEYRTTYGLFTSIDSLTKVSGIGKVKMAKLKDKITVENK